MGNAYHQSLPLSHEKMISALSDKIRSGCGWIGFFLVLLFPACGQNPHQPSEPFVVRDSLEITIVENDIQAGLRICHVSDQPMVSIGEADGEEPYLLYRVFDSTRLSDGRIALVNQGSYQVRIYDSDGQFISTFGREGEGPGEFRRVFQIWSLPGDTLWVGDYRPWRFQIFDPKGNYVRGFEPMPSYLISPNEMDLLDDGRSILGKRLIDRSNPNFTPSQMQIVLHSSSGEAIDTLGYYPAGSWGQLSDAPSNSFTYPLFESFSRLATRGNAFAIGNGSKAEISIFEASSPVALRRVIRWTTNDRSVSAEHIRSREDQYRQRYANLDEATRNSLLASVVNPDRPVRDQFPAFNALLFGTDQHLWVREYPIPGQADGQTWIVFDQEGRYECSVVIPEGLEVDEIGSDYVLGEVRDESGVERVVMYALEEPSSVR